MPIPIYVTPLYDSRGPSIAVGVWSERLAGANSDSIRGLADQMEREWDRLPAEAMYVLAIRLYDLGHKDEAVRLFYAAQFRGWLFHAVLAKPPEATLGEPAFESTSAFAAFNQPAGDYINGYAFGDLEKLRATLREVREEGERTMPRFVEIYPRVSFAGQAEWPAKARGVAAGLSELIEILDQRADEIRAARRQSGIEGKY